MASESKLVRLQIRQAMRVLEACGWEMTSQPDPAADDGFAYQARSLDGSAETDFYTDRHSALFFALVSHIGNGHWKREQEDKTERHETENRALREALADLLGSGQTAWPVPFTKAEIATAEALLSTLLTPASPREPTE